MGGWWWGGGGGGGGGAEGRGVVVEGSFWRINRDKKALKGQTLQ